MNRQMEAIYESYMQDEDRRGVEADNKIEEANNKLVDWLLKNGKFDIKNLKEPNIESEIHFKVIEATLEAHKVGFEEGFREAGKLFGALL